MVNQRRKLLDYIKSSKPETYTKLISDLGLEDKPSLISSNRLITEQ